ncbi:unnamed protein product [Rhizoctonia solani]|uniref:PIN domain-containing protein n=1 Tax=Rhizoctonia solani TaxID=456999 RepID=A0A8H3C3N8_9AGAM|nr:unnamed protein product [Rhizoctonia solani]
MGKAKTTRKFATVKRMLNPNDIRLKENQAKQKQKETKAKEEAVRRLPQTPSSLFFQHNTALAPPYRVLIDTNFINFSLQNKLELVQGMMDCLYAKYCVIAELEKLGPKYRIALRVARDPRFERLPCSHQGTYADDCLVHRVTANKCYIVATCDRELRRRIRKGPSEMGDVLEVMAHCSWAGPLSTRGRIIQRSADVMDESNTDTTMNLNMTPSSSRTVLPSSVADFALAHSPRSAPPSPSSPVLFIDEYLPSNIRKLRRPSLLGTAMVRPPSAPHSPLASSFALEGPRRTRSKSAVRPTRRQPNSNSNSHSNSESSSGSPAPAMLLDPCSRPSTPPARIPHRRTLSNGTPFKLPRLVSIQSEVSNPADAELKSEASFQRLLASNADLPGAFHPHPRPRRRDRGRFPEVYLDDDDVVDSDDDDEVMVPKEFPMDDVLDSPARMDVDMGSYGSPPVLGSLFSLKGWRQTPPPTVAPSRIAKRKLDDRYEPYPQKRRALSPSASTFTSSASSNAQFNLSMPPTTTPRSPITTAAPAPRPGLAPSAPIAIPARTPNKAYNYTPGGGLFGSPIISSPVLRPVRVGLSTRGEKEVDGAGNGVRSLDLGG